MCNCAESGMSSEASVTTWVQRELQLPAMRRGCHPITERIIEAMPELQYVRVGLLHVFIQHTSASLTINENADPAVLKDLDDVLDALVPERPTYRHAEEGEDDMPGHAKASLLGSSLTVPVRHGRLCLGVWQGICLCEHRSRAGPRRLILTLQGDIVGISQ